MEALPTSSPQAPEGSVDAAPSLKERHLRLTTSYMISLEDLKDKTYLEKKVCTDSLEQMCPGLLKEHIGNVMITKIVLRSCQNTTDLPLLVTFPSLVRHDRVSQQAYTLEGKAHHATLWPRETHRGEGSVVFEDARPHQDPLFKKYGGMTRDALWHGIITFNYKKAYFMVPAHHVAVELIRKNPAYLGEPPREEDLTKDQEMYTLPADQVTKALGLLEKNVLSQFSYDNLSDFRIHFSRADGKPFGDVADLYPQGEGDANDVAYFLNTKFHIGCQLDVSFVAPGLP